VVPLNTLVTDITSKNLQEKTGQVLDRLRRGERFRVLRDGEPEALMVPVEEAIDPEWPEITRAALSTSGRAKANSYQLFPARTFVATAPQIRFRYPPRPDWI